MRLLVMLFLHPSVTSSRFGPNIFLRPLFSDIFLAIPTNNINSLQIYIVYTSLWLPLYCHVYRVCVCGSVTNNNTWIRIGYRIYSL
jgi:hypothetical protein